MGRIDDSLVKRHQLKETIVKELKGINASGLTSAELRKINRRLLRLTPRSPDILLEILVTSNELPGELIILLLDDMKNEKILRRVNEILENPRLADKTRSHLITLKALKEYTDKPQRDLLGDKEAVNELLTATETLWRQLEDEEIASLWLEEYWQMEKKDKMMLLEVFLKRAERFYLPVLRLEVENPDVEIVRQVARGLANFDYPLAGKLLRRLLDHKDMGVRLDAEYSLKQFEERERIAERPQEAPPQEQFYRALVGEDPRTGQYTVVYSTIAPDLPGSVPGPEQDRDRQTGGSIKFMNVWIDSWDRGIIDCWGNIRYTPEQFSEMIVTFNQRDDYVRHHEVEKDYAVFLIRKALELTQQRGYRVPTELFVWWGMIEDVPFDPKKYHVAFGLHCLECGEPIQTGKRRSSLWIIGDGKALCPRCVRKKKQCTLCGEHIKDLVSAFALVDAETGTISVMCKKCYESQKT
jgi:hypothetical protein